MMSSDEEIRAPTPGHSGRTTVRPLLWLLGITLAVAAWLVVFGPDGFGTGGLLEEEVAMRGGSAEPCAVPLAWRIGEIDPRFGIDRFEAERAMTEAARYWEDAVGRPLFPRDPDDGLPVRFVFDDRQAIAQERNERSGELAQVDERLDRLREDLNRGFDRLNGEIARHNERVRAWNERGGAPSDVLDEMAAIEAALSAREAELNEQAEQLNRAVTDRNRSWEALRDEFPERTVESGYYGEQVRFRGGRVAEVSDREIRIHYFDDRDELVLVLAHELGHALGLGHTDMDQAVMSEVHRGAVPILHPGDLELLRDICPNLVD